MAETLSSDTNAHQQDLTTHMPGLKVAHLGPMYVLKQRFRAGVMQTVVFWLGNSSSCSYLTSES